MESRISHIFLAGLLVAFVTIASPVWAKVDQPVIEPEIIRMDLSEADIDTENFEIGIFAGQINFEDFGSNPLVGLMVTFHASEDIFLEANYVRSSIESLPGGDALGRSSIIDDDITYYDLSLGFNLLPGEVFIGKDKAFNSALYLVAGAGITEFNGQDEFTINVGGGFRLILTDLFAVHFDVRNHVFNREVLGSEERSFNLDMHLGLSAFF